MPLPVAPPAIRLPAVCRAGLVVAAQWALATAVLAQAPVVPPAPGAAAPVSAPPAGAIKPVSLLDWGIVAVMVGLALFVVCRSSRRN